MSQPTVCAVMLANGRPEMVERAVKSFLAQMYERKVLAIYDTTPHDTSFHALYNSMGRVIDEFPTDERSNVRSIGALRNGANGHVDEDIICHWDSDDWSHPNRIAEQVALLQSSGAECVGYHEMLFWVEPQTIEIDVSVFAGPPKSVPAQRRGQSWLYRSQLSDYAIGTSMCYWRETWERHPFPDRSEGCDDLYWHTGGLVKIDTIGSIMPMSDPRRLSILQEPRMVAGIHGANTCARVQPGVPEWRRVPEWDEYARGVMAI